MSEMADITRMIAAQLKKRGRALVFVAHRDNAGKRATKEALEAARSEGLLDENGELADSPPVDNTQPESEEERSDSVDRNDPDDSVPANLVLPESSDETPREDEPGGGGISGSGACRCPVVDGDSALSDHRILRL